MKVVINKQYGGFGLSNEAAEACVALGMDGWFGKMGNSLGGRRYYYCEHQDDKEFRCDPRLVQVVERHGSAADGDFAKLVIVDVPFDTVDGWYIHYYDGMETIEQDHMSWG